MGTGMRRGAGLWLALAWTAALSAQPPTATLRGQVTDSLGFPVVGAEIRVLGTEAVAVADSQGLFHLTSLPVGTRLVYVRAVGWKPLTFSIELAADQEWTGRIGLEPAPDVLPEITVEGRADKPARYAGTTRFDDFFRRRRLALGGIFRTREEIERLHAISTGELLKGIAGVHVAFGPTGASVTFTRCPNPTHVALWIDGNRVRIENINVALGTIDPNDVEAIEVYRSAVQIPAEFLENACAAVVVWTRYH